MKMRRHNWEALVLFGGIAAIFALGIGTNFDPPGWTMWIVQLCFGTWMFYLGWTARHHHQTHLDFLREWNEARNAGDWK